MPGRRSEGRSDTFRCPIGARLHPEKGRLLADRVEGRLKIERSFRTRTVDQRIAQKSGYRGPVSRVWPKEVIERNIKRAETELEEVVRV